VHKRRLRVRAHACAQVWEGADASGGVCVGGGGGEKLGGWGGGGGFPGMGAPL